jgi:hypothetical protein
VTGAAGFRPSAESGCAGGRNALFRQGMRDALARPAVVPSAARHHRRRGLLACLAVGATATASMLVASPARAFRREAMRPEDREAYDAAAACPATAGGAAGRDGGEPSSVAGDSPTASEDRPARLCPWCGCPVLGAAPDHGEGDDRPGPPVELAPRG